MAGIKNPFLRKFFLLWVVLTLSLTSCSRLEQLQSDNTPEQWLASHSHVLVKTGPFDFVFAEPSSTIFVYGLGLILLWAAWRFYAHKKDSRSGKLWALGLLVWALSTFSAGTSYQAFSYEIKCAGKEICSWTSWWEIWYMALFVLSMGIIAAAVAFSSLSHRARKFFLIYLILITGAYEIVLFSGALLPNQLMVSFEFMLLFVVPTFLALFAVNITGYVRRKETLEVRLLLAWVLMALVTAAYFGFLLSGIAKQLWDSGIWFNANDVLHIGLIGWVLYLVFQCEHLIADKAEQAHTG
jgi:uncharacterized membrane protein YwzB